MSLYHPRHDEIDGWIVELLTFINQQEKAQYISIDEVPRDIIVDNLIAVWGTHILAQKLIRALSITLESSRVKEADNDAI